MVYAVLTSRFLTTVELKMIISHIMINDNLDFPVVKKF